MPDGQTLFFRDFQGHIFEGFMDEALTERAGLATPPNAWKPKVIRD